MPAIPNQAAARPSYVCPMHREVRQANPGPCPKCGMDLVPEGAKFGLLRHMMSMPRHMIRKPLVLIIMVAVMVAVMVAIMMMR